MPLQELLSYLAKHAKISGSWARGEQRPNSDIDLVCTFKQIDKIANYLNKLGCKWDSDLSGYITIPSSEFGIFIEVSVLFPRYKNYKSVDVLGVTFKT